MAKLDQVKLKTSILAEEDLRAVLRGDGEAGDKLEAGEIVIRRDAGRVEIWALDLQDQPQQISVQVEGIIPPWDPGLIEQCALGDLSDVSYTDGNPGGLGATEAGYVLTWDGTKWVVREQLAAQISDGIIPSLNLIGDVNYSLYAGPPQNKYNPEQFDVLWWDYDYTQSKYVWGPIAFKPENLQNVTLDKNTRRLIFNSSNYSGLFLNYSSGLQSPCTLVNGIYQFAWSGSPKLGIDKTIELYWQRSSSDDAQDLEPIYGIRIKEENFTSYLPTEYYYTTLRHVRDDWITHNIGDLANVNETGVIQGQALTYDALSATWRPSSGVAPDLSQGSIAELKDVQISAPKPRQHLTYTVDDIWANEYTELGEAIPYVRTSELAQSVNDQLFRSETDPAFKYDYNCKSCNAANVGRFATINNLPYLCLRARGTTGNTSNNTYAYQRILMDGWNQQKYGGYPPDENSHSAVINNQIRRTDPLAEVAYEGQLGSLENVSTANAKAGSTIVYNGQNGKFQIGFPNIDLGAYQLDMLGDVCPSPASAGYALIWNGSCWEAAPVDQKIRLNDLQDVQFGTTGVQNNKLVAAYMLVDGEQTDYKAEQDLSPTLTVSTPKQNAELGSTRVVASPEGFLYSTCRRFYMDPNWSIAQKLDNYIRWNNDNSWQEINGDGCIEVYFYIDQLLSTRTIFRKEATVSAAGGYVLRVGGDGSMYFGVSGSTGNTGFTITLPFNSVSINNWHHVAVTKERNVNRLYFDGAKVGEAISNAPWTGDGKFALGRNDLDDNNGLTHHFFQGAMLDFRVTKGRAKYTEDFYTQPASLEDEILDTTPNAGDFIQFNGTYWTNVKGVEGDISNKSITELNDVDTTSNNPEQGDALVWTGAQWEPGIPGIGATWSLDDMTDVSTCYQCARPSISFDQAEMIIFTDAFSTPGDASYVYHDRSAGTGMVYFDTSYTCNPQVAGRDGQYADSTSTYFYAGRRGYAGIRGERVYIENHFSDCQFITRFYHEQTLHYRSVPNRNHDGHPAGLLVDTIDPDQVPETFVPPWGVIEDRMCQLLPKGKLGCLGDVNTSGATTGQALIWDGTNWKPSSDIAADISNNSINDLSDVDAAGAGDNQVLTWDAGVLKWKPTDKTNDIFEFDAIYPELITNTEPLNRTNFRYAEEAEQELSPSNSNKSRANEIMDLGGPASSEKGQGIRGVGGWSYNTQQINGQIAAGVKRWFLYGIASAKGGTTVLTSPDNGSYTSHISLNPYFIRIGDEGGALVGSEGLRLAQGWRLLYEDTSIDWDEFGSYEVPYKAAINSRIVEVSENLNLGLYDLEELKNVQTTGKQQGWALTWDATNLNWIASAEVAANISLSSIGELNDVEKISNTDVDTNDGSLSFDVGSLRTSRPWAEGGGLILESADTSAPLSLKGHYGWADDAPGQPEIRREQDGETASMRWGKGVITMDAPRSLEYNAQPSLNELSVPTWLQVQQQIVRQATDFTALFLLNGNDFLEKVYGWPIQVAMTTAPNPIYASRFPDQYSYNFLKSSQDLMTWAPENGCPSSFSYEEPWSIELWLFIDSATTGDGYNENIVCTKTSGRAGPFIGLRGNNRRKVFASVSNQNTSTTPGGLYAEADLNVDDWNHLYLCNEGAGRYRFYVNGAKAGAWTRSGGVFMDGGLNFGGRFGSVSDLRTYLTGYLDDIRITKTWVPYPVDQETIPVPSQPLEPTEGVYGYGTLNSLLDVDLVTNGPPFNGQVLMFNGITQIWEPGPPDAVAYDISGNMLTDLGDVNTENSVPDQDDVLHWDNTNLEWRRTKVDGQGGVRPLNRRSSTAGVVPTAATLRQGELFINMTDRIMYALDSAGEAFAFANGDQNVADEIGKINRVVGGTF